MGNFEKLSVLVIVVIIVMILVVALYTWTDNPDHASGAQTMAAVGPEAAPQPPPTPVVDGPGMGGIVVPAPTPAKPPAEQKTFAQLIAEANPPKPLPDATPPVSPPPTPPPAEPKTHVVQAGETPSRIAKMYYPQSPVKGLAAIHAANPGMSDTSLRVGSKLVIPELTAEGGAPAVQPANGTGPTPTPKATPPTIQRGGTYVVRKGDTLVRISKMAFGTTDRWSDIWLANFDAIDDVDHPAPGTRLKIPR